jgi:hypothetical protein
MSNIRKLTLKAQVKRIAQTGFEVAKQRDILGSEILRGYYYLNEQINKHL